MYSNIYDNGNFNLCNSRTWLIQQGVRQRRVLSPLLFSFFITELIDKISEMKYDCLLAHLKFNILCYADDIAPNAFFV